MSPGVVHHRACPGCLGNGACWVCLGSGYLGPDVNARCRRCAGTGECAESSPDQATGRLVG